MVSLPVCVKAEIDERGSEKTLGCYRQCSGERDPLWGSARPWAVPIA